MVPVRVFRKISKYLKVSSSDKDKKASLSSVFLLFSAFLLLSVQTQTTYGKLSFILLIYMLYYIDFLFFFYALKFL